MRLLACLTHRLRQFGPLFRHDASNVAFDAVNHPGESRTRTVLAVSACGFCRP